MALDKLVYQKLLEVLELSEQGNTETQKYVHESLSSFEQNRNDVSLYYLEAALGARSVHAKQMALLLLKNNVLQNWARMGPAIQDLVRTEIVKILNLKEVQLRNAVAACYVNIFHSQGYEKWPYGVENLLSILSGAHDPVVQETAVVTLNMILEDSLAPGYPMAPAYHAYLRGPFLQSLFQIAPGSAGATELVARVFDVLMDSPPFLHHLLGETFGAFWNLLGAMAALDNYNVKKCVIKGMLKTWDASPATILGASEAIFPFVTRLCSDEAYTIQIEALDFYTHVLQSQLYAGTPRGAEDLRNQLLAKLGTQFPALLKTLVDNTRYSSWDYMSMDRSHLEDDNANIPDDMQDVPVKSREDEETNTWGNTWTVRKGSALLLDTIAQAYCQTPDNQVIGVLLGFIQEKLDSADWELRESGVLTLGAIAKGALYALFPYLPKVVDYLIAVARDRVPLLRIISFWCLSRFVEWIFMPENTRGFLERSLRAILEGMVDRNKRVQESACSAFTAFEECGATLLLPYVPHVLRVVLRCLESYQARNFMILYDVVGTLYQSVGDQVVADPGHAVLMDALLRKLETTPAADLHFPALMECLSSVVSTLGNKLPAAFVERLTTLSILTLHQLSGDPSELDTAHQAVEILADMLSVLLTSGAGDAPSAAGGPSLEPYDLNKVVLGVIAQLRVSRNVDVVAVANALCASHVPSVAQSSIALLGDLSNSRLALSEHSLAVLTSSLEAYLGSCQAGTPGSAAASAASSRHSSVQPPDSGELRSRAAERDYCFGIVNNCVWVLGVLCDNQLALYAGANLDVVFVLLVRALRQCAGNLCVLQNCCVALGKFARHFAPVALRYLGAFLRPVCEHLAHSKNDAEKAATVMALSHLMHRFLEPAGAGSGSEEPEPGALLALVRLYLSSARGSLEDFGDSFGANAELLRASAAVTKALLVRFPALRELLDPQTAREVQALLQHAA